MFKTRRKYDIKNFYVGELYISTRINRPLGLSPNKEITKENRIKYDIQKKTVMNGAIDINNHFHQSKDNGLRWYNGYLTIFYKVNNSYICLHNGNTYRLTGEDFCENLFGLHTLLPKISYACPKEISNEDSLKMFKQLFDKKYEYKTEKFYTNESYKLDSFYVGTLAFCYEYTSLKLDERISKNIDTPQHYILNKSDAYLSYITGCSDEEKQIDYDHLHFYTLFLKRKKGLYNLHNFQFYNSGVLTKEHFHDYKQNESYYDWMVPFKEVLEEKKVRYNSDTITIPKALKLYRKIK